MVAGQNQSGCSPWVSFKLFLPYVLPNLAREGEMARVPAGRQFDTTDRSSWVEILTKAIISLSWVRHLNKKQ